MPHDSISVIFLFARWGNTEWGLGYETKINKQGRGLNKV